MVKVLAHYLNPLFLFCRLRDIGVSKEKAMAIGRQYELIFFRHRQQDELDKTISRLKNQIDFFESQPINPNSKKLRFIKQTYRQLLIRRQENR